MSFAVEVLRHSIHKGKAIATLKLRYPRFIHAEFMTHRMFSRNASSSRAIPVSRIIQEVIDDPAMPIHWGKNQPGMQAREELTGQPLRDAKFWWVAAANEAVEKAQLLHGLDVHKQIVNRVLEPYSHITVIVTATEWDNFFNLRRHEDAQPEIKYLADLMWDAMEKSVPRELAVGEWHLAFDCDNTSSPRLSALIDGARCARTSYNNHDGSRSDPDKDWALAIRLTSSGHWSPFEHQATPYGPSHGSKEVQRNFRGWTQHRALLGG